jgi:hypothetical protein
LKKNHPNKIIYYFVIKKEKVDEKKVAHAMDGRLLDMEYDGR